MNRSLKVLSVATVMTATISLDLSPRDVTYGSGAIWVVGDAA